MLYMTARAIGQYGQTKQFLRKEVEESIFHLMQTGSIFLLGRCASNCLRCSSSAFR